MNTISLNRCITFAALVSAFACAPYYYDEYGYDEYGYEEEVIYDHAGSYDTNVDRSNGVLRFQVETIFPRTSLVQASLEQPDGQTTSSHAWTDECFMSLDMNEAWTHKTEFECTNPYFGPYVLDIRNKEEHEVDIKLTVYREGMNASQASSTLYTQDIHLTALEDYSVPVLFDSP